MTVARLRRRTRDRARTIEAAVLLTAGAAAQRWIAMPRWSWVLGQAAPVPDSWRGQAVQQLPVCAATPVERRVAGSVARASRLLPFQPSCLAQATAGQVLLRRRRQPGTVVIGLRRGERASEVEATTESESSTGSGGWQAHAWLLGREGALTGGPAANGFTATTVFRPAT